ncbi:MAG TPA: hypothetical protein VLV78_04060 [Thermoanaerobaculia bacterium]|nr:hypothetical protein [Thermoanaerobaculia bacterium]
MRRSALLIAVAMAWALNDSAATQRPLIVTSQDHSLADSDDCASFYTQSTTSLPSQASSQEQRRLSLIGVDLLHVRTSNAGGVAVRGWDRPFARLTICKYAAGLTEPQAQRTLQDVGVAVSPGEIVAHGPEATTTQTWWVHMILRVPRTANVDVQAANGGIAVRNMTGRVSAQATNGGISLASCSGENRIATENGGISLDKIDRVNATTQNGPIAFKLHDAAVPALEARTDDEIVCRLKVCSDGWSADRKRLRIGTSAPQIRLMTNTAPILIEQVR